MDLVKMVIKMKLPLEHARRQLGLKKSTAINIIEVFKSQGKVPLRKFKKISKTPKMPSKNG